MTIRDLTAGRVREANTTITAVLMAPCGLACAGTVVPGLDQTVTLVLFALGALALAPWGCGGRHGGCGSVLRTGPMPTPPPSGEPSTRRTCSTPPTARTSPHG